MAIANAIGQPLGLNGQIIVCYIDNALFVRKLIAIGRSIRLHAGAAYLTVSPETSTIEVLSIVVATSAICDPPLSRVPNPLSQRADHHGRCRIRDFDPFARRVLHARIEPVVVHWMKHRRAAARDLFA